MAYGAGMQRLNPCEDALVLGLLRKFCPAPDAVLVPYEELDVVQELGDIPEDAIPDVAADDDGADEIYAFYRAGILSGYTQTAGYAEHAFGPGSSITRAEVAAIMSRMFDKTVRLSFEID